jgi:hypothetical protein
MAFPSPMVAMTMMGAAKLGRMCLKIMIHSLQPRALAAMTYSLSFMVRTALRMTWELPLNPPMARAMMNAGRENWTSFRRGSRLRGMFSRGGE